VKPFEEFFKSFASFVWAMPVFGVSQAGKMLRGLRTSDPTQLATQSFEQITATVKAQFDAFDTTLFHTGERVQNTVIDLAYSLLPVQQGPSKGTSKQGEPGAGDVHMPNPSSPSAVPATNPPLRTSHPYEARSTSVEEVFTIYNVGRGTFDHTTHYINLQADMFDLMGQWVGIQTGVHVNTTPPDPPDLLPRRLFAVPPAPPRPIDQPLVPHEHRTEWTKGLFTFADGSSMVGEGPAWTHLIPVVDGAFIFMVTTSQVITQGTGVFEGVQGIKQGTGSTYVAPGLFPAQFPSPGFEFTAKSIDLFRIVRKGFLK
jgi:hypothetical protein